MPKPSAMVTEYQKQQIEARVRVTGLQAAYRSQIKRNGIASR
jgi:hypothetical protein